MFYVGGGALEAGIGLPACRVTAAGTGKTAESADCRISRSNSKDLIHYIYYISRCAYGVFIYIYRYIYIYI